jgi:5-methylcytosine-specific restriction endonuclease McrA
MLNFSYEPLGVVSVQRAVRLLFAQKAEIVHDAGRFLHSGRNRRTGEIAAWPLPSVVRLLYYVMRRHKTVPLTKKNVLLRDDHTCQYCTKKGGHEMTVDHVQPRSRNGASSWTNLVACCSPCNARKRDRTPAEAGMTLRCKPCVPRYIPFVVVKRNTLPNEWMNYLNLYDVGIEERIL